MSERHGRIAAMIIVALSLLGFPLAYHKAVLAPTLVWVGVELTVASGAVTAKVPAGKVAELKLQLQDFCETNVVSKKALWTLIGKAMSSASVIHIWRLFIQEMYVALRCHEIHALKGCIWTKQILRSEWWLLVFLGEQDANITLVYSLDHFLRKGPQILITWDASPYGMSSTLQVEAEFRE